MLAKRLRWRAENGKNLTPEQRKELIRRARNLEMLIEWAERKARAEGPNPTRGDLHWLFDHESWVTHSLKYELSFEQMHRLADSFDGWAMRPGGRPAVTARLMGVAEGFRRLAEKVGPDWRPPPAKRLSLLDFIGRLSTEVTETSVTNERRRRAREDIDWYLNHLNRK